MVGKFNGNSLSNICPICEWDQLTEPPYSGEHLVGSDEICPSCGFQFGYSDDGAASGRYPLEWTREMIVLDYRQKWIDNGMKWRFPNDPFYPRPQNWNPEEQLKNIGINLE